ncbi:GTP 3',8-cyclase MoaA [Stenotrophomonas acidaminiphila]|jgi:cyclic pyranopterin phosphate synthase|uniref:GTP 3',8-cyclase MoaA n=1 Tax=Stenotrophomonas acidaminiphila TaxID=128780 RepID=UPI000BCF0741|nr:GTP 3',8-cyclase MoaA [Stenotrophomonas acidaminiphila]OZB52769.1 MAG: GTP 3',8-cyclase MoaA [Stenotrophomonas sp. 14-69-23]WHL18777.1 GTP 3',8-cyclase MoaA [Stenotrophomonas acidaminiphila]
MSQLTDGFGRSFPYLRLSLTEACNFRCSYCLPDGYHADGRPRFLAVDEIARLVRAFATLGMHKIRLTGGEPSLRRDLTRIIATVARVPGIRKVAITTNGTRLPRYLPDWHQAGLTALNVSVDSLQRERFHAITGHDRLPEVLDGIAMAQALGLQSVKLNAVLLRDRNDDELPAWMEFLRERALSVRFIELMRTGDNGDYFQRHHLRADVLVEQLQAAGWSLRPRAADAGPAREYVHPAYRGSIGIIAPYSRDFCAGCNRLRVTARGDLRLCLFGDFGVALRPLLQSDADHDALLARITTQLGLKAAGHGLHQGRTGLTPHLASIGG